MTERKDSYRAALQRKPSTPRTTGTFVIRTKPVCVTIDLAPGLQHAIRRCADQPVTRLATAEAAVGDFVRTVTGRIRRLF